MNDITQSSQWDFLTRPSVKALDETLGVPVPCLDHGFIRVVDYMGNENAVVQAARVSYGKGTKTVTEDRGLIRYLLSHQHTTPFEMCEIKLHVKLPIFVARQWIRHRTANVNEYSARYSLLAREFYIPEPDDIMPQSQTNRQGRNGELPEDVRRAMSKTIDQHSQGAYDIYQELASGWPWFHADGSRVDPHNDDVEQHDQDHGAARELARMVVPPNVYTEWYWKVDLHNLLGFLALRADPHAQAEIRVYADAICEIVKTWVPSVWEAFVDYKLEAQKFSRMEMDVLKTLLAAVPVTDALRLISGTEGASKREIAAFQTKLGLV